MKKGNDPENNLCYPQNLKQGKHRKMLQVANTVAEDALTATVAELLLKETQKTVSQQTPSKRGRGEIKKKKC